MPRSIIRHARVRFIWLAAGIATVLAVIGALLVAGAGPTPAGRVTAALVGFVVLGAGTAVALAMAVPDEGWHGPKDDWPW